MLEGTGGRFLPWIEGARVHYEHLHRYAFASELVKGKKVLDLACGEGYGPYMLSKEAKHVVGIDICEQVVNHAQSRYSRHNLKFIQGSVLEIPIEGGKEFDVVVCFEGIEHVEEHDRLLSEVKRLLKDGGLFIVSTPNKATYTDEPQYHNSFHVKELYFDEFKRLLSGYFSNVRFLGQKVYTGSNLWDMSSPEGSNYKEFVVERGEKEFYFAQSDRKAPLYFIALASDGDLEPYISTINSSWLTDASDALIKDHEKQIAELTSALQARDSQIQGLEASLEEKSAEITQLQAGSGRIINMIFWGVMMRVYSLVNRILPPETQRRELAASFLALIASPFLKRGTGVQKTSVEDTSFFCKVESELSRPLEVGVGTALRVSGWCYHTKHKIKNLYIIVDGSVHRVTNFSLPRPDVLWEEHRRGHDIRGNSLSSGFWAIVPIYERKTPCSLEVYVEAVLSNGEKCKTKVAELDIQPPRRDRLVLQSLHVRTQQDKPLVAICMATYNPPVDLFERQIDSIIKQTYRNWICIVNDDCSEPENYERIVHITSKDERFHVYRNSSNLGFYYNFERCLGRVPDEASFVAFSDQDDYWHSDKIATCLSAFDADTTLVYSDMNIVNDEGTLLHDTFWKFRKNNYTRLDLLLVANTITGAASMFRRDLLRFILPFPERLCYSFHDWWVGCVALATGRLKFIDRPLYDYCQHSGSILGYSLQSGERTTPGRQRRRSFIGFLDWCKESVQACRAIYDNDFLRVLLAANTIKVRCREAPQDKLAIINQFVRLEKSWLGLFYLFLKARTTCRTILGAEIRLLGGVLLTRFSKSYYRLAKKWLLLKRIMPIVDGSRGSRVIDAVNFIAQKIAPLKLKIDPEAESRVNILIPTIDFSVFYGGYIAKFNFAKALKLAGYKVRMIIVDQCDYKPSEWRNEFKKYGDLSGLFDEIEVAYAFDRSRIIEISQDDIFIATTWWTAYIANDAVKQTTAKKFLHLIQEYEPFTFPMGTFYSLAQNAHSFPHYAIFSTEFLRDYFRQNRIGVFSQSRALGERNSTSFQNAISSFEVSEERIRERKPKKLLFYARLEEHASRNMVELGLMALMSAVKKGYFAPGAWEFHGIGSSIFSGEIELCPGTKMRFTPRLSLGEYRELLPEFDLGMSLQLTPHPSLVPLDMAAAGMVVITNSFANKTREKLEELSCNIIVAEPTIVGVEQALYSAVACVTDYERRIRGSHIKWCRDWTESFNSDVMSKLREFIEQERRLLL